MTDLLSLQREFHRALRKDAAALTGIVPDAERRLSIHRTTVEMGLSVTLANAFPIVRRVVGAPTFAMLATDFIAATPPRHPLLSTYGKDFPTFAAKQPIGATLAYLHDLARLEWARQEAFLAADAAPLDAKQLDTGDAEALSSLRLRLHPATRIVTSPFPIHRIWRMNQPDVATDDIPVIDMTIAEHVAVTRPQGEIVTRAIGLADATMIRTLAQGESLNSAIEAAFAVSAEFDVATTLAGHFANGTFTAIP